MDLEIWIGLAVGLLIPIVLTWTGRLQARITTAKEDLSKFMIKAAETYITKADLNTFAENIYKRLETLEAKIDSLLERK